MEAQLLSVRLIHSGGNRCVAVSHLLPLDDVPNCTCVCSDGKQKQKTNRCSFIPKLAHQLERQAWPLRPSLGRRVPFDNLWNAAQRLWPTLCQCSHPEPGAQIKALINQLRYPIRNELEQPNGLSLR